jgi:GNAT superfamily N-acetyltransferase
MARTYDAEQGFQGMDRRYFFSPPCPWEAVERAGVGHIDPDQMLLRFASGAPEDQLVAAVCEMARAPDDRVYPEHSLRADADLDGFTLLLSDIDHPSDVLALLTGNAEISPPGLTLHIEAIFTDAEWRGEGLGRILMGGASLMIDRIMERAQARSIHLDPGAIDIQGEAVSPGGRSLLDLLLEQSSLRGMPGFDDVEQLAL